MLVLVATATTQGQRRNDFTGHTPGELVVHGSECDGETVDGGCGCRRSLTGVDSHKGGTTFEVAERDLTREQVVEAAMRYLKAGGWAAISSDADAWAAELAEENMSVAKFFGLGTIVERRGDRYASRAAKTPQPHPARH